MGGTFFYFGRVCLGVNSSRWAGEVDGLRWRIGERGLDSTRTLKNKGGACARSINRNRGGG